jgi:hypothetical protein
VWATVLFDEVRELGYERRIRRSPARSETDNTDLNVDDRLRRQPDDGRAADVLDLHNPRPEGIAQVGRGRVESFKPVCIVVDDHDWLGAHDENVSPALLCDRTATDRRIGDVST